ncbi:hypothetical protein Pla52n_35180 [Stieleria varia]|uniref:Uncharacterized protein n=1 Tax=Stieleria varia TaxID=2528005 RepID=A0A5C6ASG1_9BACT|nr:hypothetical protein Pla52n_35180 [Stieleria varia]
MRLAGAFSVRGDGFWVNRLDEPLHGEVSTAHRGVAHAAPRCSIHWCNGSCSTHLKAAGAAGRPSEPQALAVGLRRIVVPAHG